jgi:hypothetical protein
VCRGAPRPHPAGLRRARAAQAFPRSRPCRRSRRTVLESRIHVAGALATERHLPFGGHALTHPATEPAGVARGRGERGQPPFVYDQRRGAARLRATVAGPRLPRDVANLAGEAPAPVDRETARPRRAGGEPGDGGKPAQLPSRDRDDFRPRQRLGYLGAAVDGRGGPAQHRRSHRRPVRRPAIGEICNLRIHHDEVVLPVVRYLDALSMEGRSADAARAQQKSVRHLEKLNGRPGPLDEKLTARKAQRRSGEFA